MSESVPDRTLYALAVLYLACSHATDGELAQTEVDAVGARLKAWAPEKSAREIGDRLARALEVYRSELARVGQAQQARASATVVRREVPEARWPEIIADMRAIAEADGIVTEGEDEVLQGALDVFAAE
jgi:hypothetical protein